MLHSLHAGNESPLTTEVVFVAGGACIVSRMEAAASQQTTFQAVPAALKEKIMLLNVRAEVMKTFHCH